MTLPELDERLKACISKEEQGALYQAFEQANPVKLLEAPFLKKYLAIIKSHFIKD